MIGAAKDGAFLTAIILFNTICQHSVNSLGKRSFGESCSFGGSITSFFSEEREERACNSDLGLVCRAGTYCACPAGRVWDFTANDYGFADRSTRGCAWAVGSPCIGGSRNQQCVSNAECQFAFCRCKPGFRRNGGHCVGAGGSTNTESSNTTDDNDEQGETRPATASGISFPELQDIFGSSFNSGNSNHHLNDYNNDRESHFNDRFQSGNNFNDRFHKDENSYNDRSQPAENFFNDRFQFSDADNTRHQHNSRDGSRGSSSGSVRFE